MFKIFFSCILFLIFISCKNNSPSAEKKQVDTIENKISPQIFTDTSTTVEINTTEGAVKLVQHKIHLQKGMDFSLNVLQGYNITVAAENLNRLRFLAKSPDGKLFATDMYNRDDNKKGKVYFFDNWDSVLHQFKTVRTYLNNLHNPNQVAFYDKYLYVAETDKLSRYIYNTADTISSSQPEIIATFPAYGLSYKYGGWHLTRSITFHQNKLYVSVGSSCNACIEKEDVRAAVLEMNPDGSDKKIFARGLRNSVGLKWIGNKLWATGMGRDLIGADKPEDLFQEIKRNEYYGWPFYFQFKNKIYKDDQFKDSARASFVKEPPLAFCGFKAHSAPLGFDYFKNFDDVVLKNAVLVALHGSTTVSRRRGNAIVKIIGGDKYVDIVSGFLSGSTEVERFGRPCDVLMHNDHSFFFTDDKNGVLYYVWKK